MSTAFHQRKAYRRREVKALFGASLRAIDRAIKEGEIRTRRYGNCVFLHPGDVERLFGFEEKPIEVSTESLAEMEAFLS